MEAVDIPPLGLDRISRFVVELGPRMSFGHGLSGKQRVIPIIGGHFGGPVLRGIVLPGGDNWQVVHADGMASIDMRTHWRHINGTSISQAVGPPVA